MTDFVTLCERIRQRDEDAARELVDLLRWRLRPVLAKYPRFKDDVFQNVCWQMIRDIRDNKIKHPESIVFYALKIALSGGWPFVARDHQTLSIDNRRVKPKAPSALDEILAAEQAWLLRKWIDRLSAQRKEIIERFYFECQPKELIQREMGLTATQFRLLKSRGLDDLRKFRREGIGDILAAA